ncbi:protein phosphatase 2C domain-containing protein [Chamaesiphon sp. GL140_3_metabinner_50]|uniref:PP2C family protein-serine/threonine phosphatase n=1 Tax=Chamaesiphon sp. GL140_3_metabinner_50 TaxID=2970812 RepID=UPI0025EB7C42|nr:protein phosphatase 2C domain-containing protein [Chamaesiphon sp. GL140_3_metabinner_50]
MKSLFAGLSDKGMVRSANQDAYYIDPDGRFFIVADGMGGHAGGEEASRIAIETSHSYLDSNWETEPDTKNLLAQALIAANEAIVADQEQNAQRADMGTTLVAILFRDDLVWSAHVGDSRLYRLRGDKLDLITEDDTWVARAMKLGQLNADEARVHPLRHVLSHCLGRRDLRQINIQTQDINANDRILLCSDGLTEEVPHDEIAIHLQAETEGIAAQALIDAAKQHGGSDNITVVIATMQQTQAV